MTRVTNGLEIGYVACGTRIMTVITLSFQDVEGTDAV
jgi:hypothetical protein